MQGQHPTRPEKVERWIYSNTSLSKKQILVERWQESRILFGYSTVLYHKTTATMLHSFEVRLNLNVQYTQSNNVCLEGLNF